MVAKAFAHTYQKLNTEKLSFLEDLLCSGLVDPEIYQLFNLKVAFYTEKRIDKN